MNLGTVELQSVHHNRPRLQRIHTDELPATPVNVRLDDDRTPSLSSSISDVPTVIRWTTPPSRFRTPKTSSEILKAESEEHSKQSTGANEAAYGSNTSLVVRFDEEQIRSIEVEASKREERMDSVDFESGPPTPNIDDTPYIRFAIDQLTRDEEVKTAQRPNSERSSDSYPVDRIVPNHLSRAYVAPGSIHTRQELALARKYRSSPKLEQLEQSEEPEQPDRLFRFNATRPLSYHSINLEPATPADIFIPVPSPLHTPRYPDLTFVPTSLRPFSMMSLAFLCSLMIAAIMFCAIYSTYHDGIVGWYGGITGGRYFVFGFLPQLLGASLFLQVQEVMCSIRRILPYTLMAMDDADSRVDALFLGLYQKNFLWPSWDGPASINVANSLFWLSIFTIPLQSCLFSVMLVDGAWRWTAVQGVAWALVAIYILILVATAITGLFFYRRTTGLMWDPRSLADVIALLPRSNSLNDYPGTDIMGSKEEIRDRLLLRSDRLGYWRTPDRTQGVFYCVGEAGASTRQYTMDAGRIQEKPAPRDFFRSSDVEKATVLCNEDVRFRYIPWYLRDTFITFWCVAAFVLLVALFVVSFLPSTAIKKGFNPQISANPDSQGFSPANFLYSFIPSNLGMILYLFFQPLDMSLRQLQPWAELGNGEGGTAEQSLLVDYTAGSHFGCAWSAFNAGHYRVAIISLLSFLFILLPILAGGLFFPLTTPSNEVRMIPNLPSFYIVLAVLVLYLIALVILIPNRRVMQLPHAVDCLAEIFSFVYNSHILEDAAFRAPRSKADLVTRLLSARARGQDAKYGFGVHRGRDQREWMGIENLSREDPPQQVQAMFEREVGLIL